MRKIIFDVIHENYKLMLYNYNYGSVFLWTK